MHHIRTDELNSGRNYLSSLHDGRKIILANTVIDDVAGDPATTAMASFIAKLLDLHHHDERLLESRGRAMGLFACGRPVRSSRTRQGF